VFCGDHLLCARLRPSNQDASAGSLEEVQRIVRQIRARWPKSRIIGRGLQEAKQEHRRTGKPARVFCEFAYRTKKSWSRARRVVAKAEQLEGKENPRYLVTKQIHRPALKAKCAPKLLHRYPALDERRQKQKRPATSCSSRRKQARLTYATVAIHNW
jgi:hypothetical protein